MARTPCPQARPVRQTRPLRRAALCRRWGLHDPRERQRAPGPEHERAERGQLHHQTEIEVTVAKCDPHALFKSHAAPSSNRNTLLWDIGDVGAGWKPRVAPALLVLLLPAWEKVFVSGGAELFHRLAGGQHRGCIDAASLGECGQSADTNSSPLWWPPLRGVVPKLLKSLTVAATAARIPRQRHLVLRRLGGGARSCSTSAAKSSWSCVFTPARSVCSSVWPPTASITSAERSATSVFHDQSFSGRKLKFTRDCERQLDHGRTLAKEKKNKNFERLSAAPPALHNLLNQMQESLATLDTRDTGLQFPSDKVLPKAQVDVAKAYESLQKRLVELLGKRCKRLLLQLYKLSYTVKLLGSVALLNPLHSYLAFEGLGERPTQDSRAQGFRHLSALM
ncbi:hypothetical protein PHYSODRAFT_335214 [Phytophthora sojae]|uniref:Uncharacterized protein n=1 Tax=Phytophthora sojae (strain P6497) TaxID=1094619 RepID=G4ZUG3_PHYSP|nr:hypothetical protein PHYSODRAFT_335214 [Phytophthora sojae]EGZ13437.1 hypothetical protein PHYSODRAFT_335214 [Phytophthora sojae]|eukprot:XP_009530866.1 hypothetical protein PHYSODRAFT_335214 [Phytophthora sojae]